ncbi:MAG TPA: flagellar biosynthesis protein FlgI, partial [Massilia timonae]|nr:flagellar biosynthesis protein FlgI [Massilia timonae]
MRKITVFMLLAAALAGTAPVAQAERLKDLATIAGVRQ